ncbi:MAG: 2-oxoacid:acceptor oxidoreductase family protein [Thermoplasmata archaeon]|nr:MAG: 2-oxoacid:acceptor oxidoreductase family protein [Thermoplasmata archaeon]
MNLRFSGFGGQGIVLSGFILGNAAVLDGKNAIQTQSYGSESRGGACRSDVIISDKNINELSPPEVDVLVSMSHSAFEKYIPMLKKGGTLIIDTDLVFPESVEGFKFYGIPATDIAYKKFGRKIIGNMVMIGYVTAITKIVTKKAARESIKSNVPKGTEDLNFKAFEEGFRLGQKEGKR